MSNIVTTINEVEFLFSNRHNLQNFHYFTNDEVIYDHFCTMVARHFDLKDDPKTASNITEEELCDLNKKYNLNLQTAYLNGPPCECGRYLNGYDFILNAIFKHGVKFLREKKTEGDAKFIMPFRRAIEFLCCSNCGALVRLRPRDWYKDSSDIDSYGPCCS